MAQWHLQSALMLWDWLHQAYPDMAQQLEAKLNLGTERFECWASIAKNIYLNQDLETGLMEQFEGFFQLEDINWADYENRTTSLQGLLGVEATSQKQILKQPDVLMLFYLLRDVYDRKTLQTNWDYYNARTDHTYGSSLGPAIHAILACDLNHPQEAYTHFMRSALVDLEDVRGNAAEGIHAASAGGVWQAVIFGFAGIRMTQFGPVACPNLPSGWTRLKFRLQWCNEWYDFDLQPEKIQTFADMQPISDPAIAGVIFDLDAVVSNTSELHYLAWQQLADEEGIEFDREANNLMRGLPSREFLLQILGIRPASEEQIQEMLERQNRYYVQHMQDVTPAHLVPGVTDLLQQVRDAGIKVALGSSNKNTETVIERLGIAKYLDAIADGYTVSQPKPAPDLLLYAAQQLGVSPSQCVVVEDAESGVEAALAARMLAIGLGSAERVGKAHVVLPSLESVRWEELRSQLMNSDQVSLVEVTV